MKSVPTRPGTWTARCSGDTTSLIALQKNCKRSRPNLRRTATVTWTCLFLNWTRVRKSISFLHVEKTETHSPESLNARNMEFYEFAYKHSLDSYDGMDVGPIAA